MQITNKVVFAIYFSPFSILSDNVLRLFAVIGFVAKTLG
jgi:hypothetical protein